MGKTGRWIRRFFTGKSRRDGSRKEAFTFAPFEANGGDHRPPKEKRRWSFRRSGRPTPLDLSAPLVTENDAKQHALAVATAAAADAAVAAARAAAAVIQLTAVASGRVEDAAAIKIQSVFRGYLARKALNALRGLVKLQALVRGHLVRKQATATLRCMQALITVQARARAQRLRAAADENLQNPRNHRFRNSNPEYDKGLEENIKIVEMDLGGYKPATKPRNSSYTVRPSNHQISPAQSAMADLSPRTCSNHFEEYSFGTAQSSPQCHSAMSKPEASRIPPFSYARSEYGESVYDEFPFYPNYMANTESSRAKVRSHSAPRSRPADAFERQTSRRRPSLEGRNVPRAVRMQRSSSQVGSTTQGYQYNPCSVKLDRSSASFKDSECGSTSTYRSFGFEVQGSGF